jgi:flagellin
MSLRINHNVAAMNAHRNLLNTTNQLHSSMERLSSGFRINQGSDDPAGLVISEQFRAQIAGLDRAIENAEGSINMIQTAEGALTEISALLISMRELAIHAANEGFNDTDQLAADQAEIDNAIKTIDRIAANTQFGTKKLIDGTKANSATITTANSSKVTIKESHLSDGQHSITATKVKESTATLNTTSLGLSLAGTNGDPYNLEEKIHNINVLQASDVAHKTSGKVNIKDAWGNGLTIADPDDAEQAHVTSAAAIAAAAATASNAGTYTVVVNYQENGESPVGAQNLLINIEAGDDSTDIAAKLQVAANSNDHLSGRVSFAASGGGVEHIHVYSAKTGSQYSVAVEGSTFQGSTGTPAAFFNFTATNDRGVSGNEMEIYARTASSSAGATKTLTIAAATYNNIDDLVTAITTQLGDATGFGSVKGDGTVDDVIAEVYDSNKIKFSTRDEGSFYQLKIGEIDSADKSFIKAIGLTEDTLANTGTDALVSFDGYNNTINKVMYGTTHEITLQNAASDSDAKGIVSMKVDKALNGVNLGNLLLDVQAARYDVRLNGGPSQTVVAGVETVVFDASRADSMKVVYGLTSEGGTEEINNVDQSLVFQIGANAGQTAKIGLRGMAASMLGQGLAGNLFRSLSDINVTSVQGAQDAQMIIDSAVNEVSTARGTLGSFQKNTLESTLRNLRVASQNLTASKSIIHDTDMAAEMSAFTKNQILVQAGTAMLAQANQVPQVVLQLFG